MCMTGTDYNNKHKFDVFKVSSKTDVIYYFFYLKHVKTHQSSSE